MQEGSQRNWKNARELLQRDFAAQALRSVEQAAEYDKALEGIRDQLYDAEAILNDLPGRFILYGFYGI